LFFSPGDVLGMSFDVCLDELKAAEQQYGDHSAAAGKALEKLIAVLRAEGRGTKVLPLLLRLKEIQDRLGLDSSSVKHDIRELLKTKDWPLAESAQDDNGTPSGTASSTVETVCEVVGSFGAFTLSSVLRTSGSVVDLTTRGVSHTSQVCSALALDAGRPKTGSVFKALELCSWSIGRSWTLTSDFAAQCVETVGQPVIKYSTQHVLEGSVWAARKVSDAWSSLRSSNPNADPIEARPTTEEPSS